MVSLARANVLKRIRQNIDRTGLHVYLVQSGATPRFAYTIGLRDSLGADLVLAGAVIFMADEILRILHAVRAQLEGGWAVGAALTVRGLGVFDLREVDASWTRRLMLGAHDYYETSAIRALQVVPSAERCTIDVPDMRAPISVSPVWRWMERAWPHPVAADAEVATNLAALRGEPITEVTRWEDGWEMFAGAGPEVSKEDMRLVPFACLLGTDPSLAPVMQTKVGEGMWRDGAGGPWHRWVSTR